MQTDLFLALLEEQNPRGHPILAALLYAYCPAAARWWLAGADPVNPAKARLAAAPFDPTWQALADLAADETLREALARHGFETLIEEAQKYVAQVDAWRDRHAGITAPELLPTFTGGRMALSQRFGLQEAFNKFGGRWENLFVYIRAWAFVVPEWERAKRFMNRPKLAPMRLALMVSGVRRPAYLPAWHWTEDGGGSTRQVIGLVSPGGRRDQLRPGLVQRSSPVGERPWPSPPEVWLLDPEQGTAEPADVLVPDEALPEVVDGLASLARDGPHAPLGALQGSSQCKNCGFRNQCFMPGGELSPLALALK